MTPENKIFYTFPMHPKNGGFVLLYAILLSTIILTIGLAILNIVITQQMLTGTQRDSQIAFYAADTALECVLYWDVAYDDFFVTKGGNVMCNNTRPDVTYSPDPLPAPTEGSPVTWTFSVEVNLANGTCAEVDMAKRIILKGGVMMVDPDFLSTQVSSHGYNTTCPSGGSSPRRLERGIRVSY